MWGERVGEERGTRPLSFFLTGIWTGIPASIHKAWISLADSAGNLMLSLFRGQESTGECSLKSLLSQVEGVRKGSEARL